MEHLIEKRDSWLTWMVFASLLIVLSLSLSGCDKKKKSNGSSRASGPGYIGGTPSCTNCGTYTDEVSAGLSFYQFGGYNLEMGIALFAPDGAFGPQGYEGPVAAQGFFKAHQPANFVGCHIPAGEYDVVSPNAAGNYSHSTTFNLLNMPIELRHRSSNLVIPALINYFEFYDYQIRVGSDGYKYQLAFFGEMLICPNQTKVFFPKK